MKIFKFGGASVKDAAGVKNVARVIAEQQFQKGLVVVSAMGKMTNAFEKIVQKYFYNEEDLSDLTEEVRQFHIDIMNELFLDKSHPVFMETEMVFSQIQAFMIKNTSKDIDYVYDQIVPCAEMISTKIVSAYLTSLGIKNKWLNATKYITTDSSYRTGEIDWKATKGRMSTITKDTLYFTQGFVGANEKGHMVTLGREGSDFTAAIFAHCLSAQSVTIWKDVEGVLNADPRRFSDTQLLHQLSYEEAVEMAFYGASVIHPKTLKPLQNKGIPLYVRSFKDLNAQGTAVKEGENIVPNVPCYIVKENQVLVAVSTKDFSFMMEESLSEVFKWLHFYQMKVDVMQNSAISFSVCIEDKYENISLLKEKLSENYSVKIQENCALYTVRHMNNRVVDFLPENNKILLKQQLNDVLQIVVK